MLAKTVSLFSQPYLDSYNQCYKNIITVNTMPQGPLSKFVRRVQFPPLSEFKSSNNCNPNKNCGLALISINNDYNSYSINNNGSNLMIVDETPDLITFLLSNGYTVDTSITKMFNASDIRFQTDNSNKLICFITYTK